MRRNTTQWQTLVAVLLAVSVAQAETVAVAAAEKPPVDPLDEYRAMVGDANPAEFWEIRGEGLWKEKRGPKNVSLTSCDLGMGKGVIKGAYARLPRYFADTQKVQDLESRLVTCMTGLQGFSEAEVVKTTFGAGDSKRSDFEALSAYVVNASRGAKMAVSLKHPKEKAAFETGKAIFFYRGGSHDFACSTCHGESDKRIRLQKLPNISDSKDAKKAYTTWPAYRISDGELRTMEWRVQDCFRQQRMPQLVFGSEGAIALITYLAASANGGELNAPALKR